MKARTTQAIEGTNGPQPIGTVHEGSAVHHLLGVLGPNGQPVCEPLDDEARESAAYWAGLRDKARASIVKAAAAAVSQRQSDEEQERQARLSEFEKQLLE